MKLVWFVDLFDENTKFKAIESAVTYILRYATKATCKTDTIVNLIGVKILFVVINLNFFSITTKRLQRKAGLT